MKSRNRHDSCARLLRIPGFPTTSCQFDEQTSWVTAQPSRCDPNSTAVSAMNMLGLSADSLQGVVLEGTKGLPGLHVAQDQTVTLTVNENGQAMVGAFYDASTTDDLNKYKVIVQ